MCCPDHPKDFKPVLDDYFHQDVVQMSSRGSISCLDINDDNHPDVI